MASHKCNRTKHNQVLNPTNAINGNSNNCFQDFDDCYCKGCGLNNSIIYLIVLIGGTAGLSFWFSKLRSKYDNKVLSKKKKQELRS